MLGEQLGWVLLQQDPPMPHYHLRHHPRLWQPEREHVVHGHQGGECGDLLAQTTSVSRLLVFVEA